jgi:hypothetical protein
MAPVIIFSEIGTLIAVLVICFAAFLVLYFFNSSFFTVPPPEGVPLLRERLGKRSFSLKNRLSYFTDCESIYREAYHDVRVLTSPICDNLTYVRSIARKARQSSSLASVSAMMSSFLLLQYAGYYRSRIACSVTMKLSSK